MSLAPDTSPVASLAPDSSPVASLAPDSSPVASLAPGPHQHPHLNPALLKHAEERANSLQNRIADKITTFAGSMGFVYLHVVWFVVWILFGTLIGFDSYPFGLLTMIVSLEAIFLSTFVMISQNRADAKRQVIADHQWLLVQEEDKQNCQLLELSQQILELTKAVHQFTSAIPTPIQPATPAAQG